MTMPSVVVMPTRRPMSLRMWAIMRTVVVLPLVPVTARIGMRDAGAGREEQVEHRLGHVLRLADGRVGVHPEAGRRVDLDDGAALLADGDGDVGHDEVDAGHVEADHAGRRLGDLDVLRVGLDRAVDRRAAGGHVAGQGELDPGARRRHRVELPALLADELLGGRVEADLGQHLLVADAAPRVLVLELDQLAHGVLPSAVTLAGTRSAMAAIRPPMTRQR